MALKASRSRLSELEQELVSDRPAGQLKPYSGGGYHDDKLAMTEAVPASSKQGRKVYQVTCGRCMSGDRPAGKAVAVYISHDPQACAERLREHYLSEHGGLA